MRDVFTERKEKKKKEIMKDKKIKNSLLMSIYSWKERQSAIP